MHITQIRQRHPQTFSFEFFPPRSPGAADKLYDSISTFEKLKPSFVSVTYGAGGGTRELTRDLVIKLKNNTSLSPVPHLTCVSHTRSEIEQILERYATNNVWNIMALRGDAPKDQPDYNHEADELPYAADLVSLIRDFGDRHNLNDGLGFGVGVAGFPEGHPGTPNRLVEMDRLKAKVDAGADYICTQLFFENRDFFDFRDRCRLAGIKVPIIAGIMPVTSVKGMMRMADLAEGARYPAPLLRAINRTGGNADAVRRVGVHWATEQCRDLLDHEVDGIHFYTLNASTATQEIYLNLGVSTTTDLVEPPPPSVG